MKQVDYKNGKIFSNVMQSVLPMLVAQVLSLLYSIVDRIYIGRIPGKGTSALGGIGLCFPVIIMVTAFTNLFGLGVRGAAGAEENGVNRFTLKPYSGGRKNNTTVISTKASCLRKQNTLSLGTDQ